MKEKSFRLLFEPKPLRFWSSAPPAHLIITRTEQLQRAYNFRNSINRNKICFFCLFVCVAEFRVSFCQASPSANERLMKPLTRCVLGLSYHSVMKMEPMRVCNAGTPLATAGALRRMEPSGLGLE